MSHAIDRLKNKHQKRTQCCKKRDMKWRWWLCVWPNCLLGSHISSCRWRRRRRHRRIAHTFTDLQAQILFSECMIISKCTHALTMNSAHTRLVIILFHQIKKKMQNTNNNTLHHRSIFVKSIYNYITEHASYTHARTQALVFVPIFSIFNSKSLNELNRINLGQRKKKLMAGKIAQWMMAMSVSFWKRKRMGETESWFFSMDACVWSIFMPYHRPIGSGRREWEKNDRK